MRYIWGLIQYDNEQEKQQDKEQNKRILKKLEKLGILKKKGLKGGNYGKIKNKNVK